MQYNILIPSIKGIRFPLQVNCVFVFPGRRNGAENLQQGKRMDEIRLGGKEIGLGYCTTCINMTPTVTAIITPNIITLDPFCMSRLAAAIIEIIAMAAISEAGAITQGMSCANITRDCI